MGIVAFSVRRNETQPDQLQAFARLQNFGREAGSRSASNCIYNDRPIRTRLASSCPPARRTTWSSTSARSTDGALHLKLHVDDDFALDNEAWAAGQPAAPGQRAAGHARQRAAAPRPWPPTAVAEARRSRDPSPRRSSKTENYRQQAAIGDVRPGDLRPLPAQGDAAGQHAVYRRGPAEERRLGTEAAAWPRRRSSISTPPIR